ncbi:MAG TPA: methionyl-tRNA formyltransferase [Actinomycetes bacterium]|nr:methionyl-tRNA formyltransferase [Actinomycetes bacterium]
MRTPARAARPAPRSHGAQAAALPWRPGCGDVHAGEASTGSGEASTGSGEAPAGQALGRKALGVRVVYFGTPAAAVPPLEALLASGHEVVGVVTRPDKPRDHRGGRPSPSPLKQAAERHGLEIVQPERGRDPELPARLAAFRADIGMTCAFGFLLPPEVLASFPRGVLNLHFSLLPAYRGPAPVQRALLDGRTVTGVCTFVIDEGMDTGPLLLSAEVPILPGEDAGALTARLAEVGAQVTVETLDALEQGAISPRPQPADGASLAPKVTPDEARLDWGASSARVVNAVRAFTPAPGAWTTLRGRRLKLLEARVAAGPSEASPGLPGSETVSGAEAVTGAHPAPAARAAGRLGLAPGELELGPGGVLLAGTGDGVVELVRVQPEGRRPMSGPEFARGARPAAGEWLGDR